MELKYRLRAGETVNGSMLSELYTPNLSRLLATCDIDFLLVDCEHGYFDMTQVANLTAVADGAKLPILVRVAQGSQTFISRYLDMGVRGILLANVTDVSQVKELVRNCLYAPLGDRGVSTFRAHTNYNNEDTQRIMRRANEQNLVIAQIESTQAIREIDDILEVEGLDGVLIGPNDLTQQMGILGQYEKKEFRDFILRVANSAASHGKWSGIITENNDLLRFCLESGMRCFSTGSELSMLAEGCKSTISRVRDIINEMNTRSSAI